MAGKSVSHHHRHSAWQREAGGGRTEIQGYRRWTERRRVYGDTGVTEMDRATGSIYSGDCGVERHHLIPSHHTTKYTLYLSQLLVSLALSEIS